VLVSRRGPAAEAAELIAELAALGAEVRMAACDVADREALAEVVAAIPEHAPLQGVVHAAGVVDDGLIGSLGAEGMATVMRPKADGAWHLHQLTRDMDLAMFVLFSSVAGILGGAGQANYGAANAFLDALAAHRRKLGLVGVSLAWGAWAQAAGMAGRLDLANRRRMARSGLGDLADAEGLALLDAAFGTEEALLVPARLDIAGLHGNGAVVPPMLSGLLPGLDVARFAGADCDGVIGVPVGAGAAGYGSAGDGLADRLAGLTEAEQDTVLQQTVRTQTALVLGMTGPDAIDSSLPFKELGFDSLAAVELRNQLVMTCGVQLQATVLFSYPTPVALAAHLRSRMTVAAADHIPVLTALDKLEAALAQLAATSEGRDQIAARLNAISTGFRGHAADSVPVGLGLDATTDDEMFDLIDQELGISR